MIFDFIHETKNVKNIKYIDLNNKDAHDYLQSDKDYKKHYEKIKDDYDGEIAIDAKTNELVGYVFIKNKKSGEEGFISPLFVVKKYRGLGIGKILLNHAINKYNAVDLVVDKDNTIAFNMYKKHGFVIIGDGNNKDQYWMKLKSKLSKDDTVITETKRSELPDSAFGIPEDRKYELNTKEHVISAIKLFGHAEESKKKSLAKRIKAAADKYGVEIKQTTQVYKYLNESYITENKKYEELYFISETKGLNRLSPRIPDNFLTKNGYEDNKTKRVCFCTNIEKCLTALSMNCTGKEFYVYQPNKSENYKVIKPTIEQVPDINITGERWICEPVDLVCIGKIKCTGDDGKEGIQYKYGNNTAELYGWNFEWIAKYPKYYSEESMLEGYVKNQKDIYYNKDKFDSGEINLCFITGHSGSGKSTMGRDMQSNNIEHYELDDLQCIKDHFTMSNLKEYGDLIYSYFNGQGKKFYITYKELIDNKIPPSEYEDILYKDFVHYAMKYANSHKDSKYVIEGVWLFCSDENKNPYFEPSEFKEYAFYIKGTSMIVSKHRGALRDAKEDNNTKLGTAKSYVNNFFRKNWKWYFIDEKQINKFRKYFSNLQRSTNESYVNESEQLEVPDNYNNDTQSVVELLDNTDPKRILLSSDWHFYSLKYKKEKNAVNTREIVSWCKNNIKDTDVFMYLGDMCFRWASDEDNNKVQEIFKSLPGIKVLILGNHDIVAGEDFYLNCGFDYVLDELVWHDCIFSHRPININNNKGININIHGHIHKWSEYNTTDGSKNVNVYPYYYDNKPVTLDYLLNNYEELIKKHGNKRSNWVGMGESSYIFGDTELDLDNINWWYVCLNNRPSCIDEELYYKTLEDAIKAYIKPEYFEKSDKITAYVYTCNGDRIDYDDNALKLIPMGKIWVDKDHNYDWTYTYPLDVIDGKIIPVTNNEYFIKESSCMIEDLLNGVNEYSAASYNPIIPTAKPHLVQLSMDNSVFSGTRFAFSQDIVSNKYMIVNENSKLEIVDASALADIKCKIYEFVGNKFNINKIEEAYKNDCTVDQAFLYTALSNKNLVTKDQIDFDDDFVPVDIELIKEKRESEKATIKEQWKCINGEQPITFPVIESSIIKNPLVGELARYNDNIHLMESVDGYYIMNDLNNKMTRCVDSLDNITIAMIKSIY